MKTDLIVILDFGSQYTQLIARRLREMKVFCQIYPFTKDISPLLNPTSEYNLKGVVLSGGPSSVMDKNAPIPNASLLKNLITRKIPVLGICYGLQLISKLSGGTVKPALIREYGLTNIRILKRDKLFKNVPKSLKVWMSHGDSVKSLPKGFSITSVSSNENLSSFSDEDLRLYAVQFHPEVNHTEFGKKIIGNFAFEICKIKNLFKTGNFIKGQVQSIRAETGTGKVICALSGGVDSSVAAVLVQKAIGNRLICIHIDTGLMRKNESEKLLKLFKEHFNLNVKLVNASSVFLRRLKRISEPEMKRKIIGNTFIEIFEREARKFKNVEYLVQGTLYPDVIESVSFKGPSATIKTHHNVGGLPMDMNLKLIEPFRELFKDEVREIGKKLGIPDYFVMRHPFPGPGLAIRIIGNVTAERLKILKEVDDIYMGLLRETGLYKRIWQAFSILLPIQTVGVMGDERTYENVVALRAVTSKDGMTADFFDFNKTFLTTVSNAIINSVRGVNRVVYDVSSKPPATIEWE
ncbi:MAG: glutamine-hydrolyzing GMP synthase [Ignavibacteriaceae bacterium]|jgi:GMP synthase (glutamine-hydrolysing)|nr:MAG: glutamine-hydrolyzing GMP synthase [Chlorobiota bacterium]KXK04118.1 MAG: GMP synthase ATPase subunit [Chlorobi bacterium OLB4]MBV6397897.1 GMP synthase [glutamine-hydrolyzing] [Ignavibacteria bacterium]MCC6886844.1 glutamine-hydrolyzing GMP synthase [Ignavibacteriales bacterium]MCE7953968.1 glutamine-hydrolyzing GMP synthase [Chlorobi bacterium CHB7]MEB2330640.1 glutamine-hydrolyzing GMP synthase [Ignavibacteriaceae bacterium]OQY76736.1 MAG: GMP synthase (glutamine-hydrolyzing) [Igna